LRKIFLLYKADTFCKVNAVSGMDGAELAIPRLSKENNM
jgi:hypothetical protein